MQCSLYGERRKTACEFWVDFPLTRKSISLEPAAVSRVRDPDLEEEANSPPQHHLTLPEAARKCFCCFWPPSPGLEGQCLWLSAEPSVPQSCWPFPLQTRLQSLPPLLTSTTHTPPGPGLEEPCEESQDLPSCLGMQGYGLGVRSLKLPIYP